MEKETFQKLLFAACLGLSAAPFTGTAAALCMGIVLSLAIGNPWPAMTSRSSKTLLQLSVVGLGFGLSLGEIIRTDKGSIVYTIVGISCTLAVGHLLGRIFRTESRTSALISFGTAICGGSAIAAMSPVVKAKDEETAVALATVFTLNAIALLLFPWVGHLIHLDQATFGTWAGLAIHDTSSVVGAASAYGAQALAVGTTVKLTRAMWITPIVIAAAALQRSGQKVKVPLFIVGFVLAAMIRTALPQFEAFWHVGAVVAKQCLVVTLFLIGTGLTRKVLRSVGVRPLLQGITLWLAVSSATLAALLLFKMV